jgi:hypothetical protein
MAKYYKPGVKRGPKPDTTFLKLYEEELKEQSKLGFRDEDGTWNEAGSLGVAMMENYIEEYGADDEWEVLVTEYPFHIIVYKPWTYDDNHPPEAQQGAEPWFEYVGVLDGTWKHRQSKQVVIPDHKTTKGIGGTAAHPNLPRYLRMDDQAGSYWSFGVEALVRAEFLRANQKLAGMLYNFMSKKMPDERPYKIVHGRRHYLNKDGTVSKKQPTPHFVRQLIHRDDYDRQYSRIRAEDDFDRIERVRNGELQPTKRPSDFSCSWCPVLDACELHETGHDWESLLKSTMQPWDPYAQHEVYEGR